MTTDVMKLTKQLNEELKASLKCPNYYSFIIEGQENESIKNLYEKYGATFSKKYESMRLKDVLSESLRTIAKNRTFEYVSKNFINKVNDYKYLCDKPIKEKLKTIGNVNGIMILNDDVILYLFNEEYVFIQRFNNRALYTIPTVFIDKYSSDGVLVELIDNVVNILYIKKIIPVETMLIAANARRKSISSNEIIHNRLPFSITHTDCSWYRTIIHTKDIDVKGHYRLQPYGKGRKLHKKIYISPFHRKYVRKAKKLINEIAAPVQNTG